MNFKINQNDTMKELIQKRISFFKEAHERHCDSKIRSICQAKISALEMILNDFITLNTLKEDKKL